jgi:Domain of unknown function (DUF6249)
VTDNLPADTDASDLASMISAAVPQHTDVAAILGIMVPIVAIVFGISMGMLGLWLDFRKKRELMQLHHAERMAAIEKGIELPPLPSEFFRDYKRRDRSDRTPLFYLRRGLMWLLIGLSATVALWGTGEKEFWWGLVPSAVGVAYLLSYLVERAQPPQSQPPEQRGL